MMIRPEKFSDIDAITEMTTIAFEDHSFIQQTEHFIIRDLRKAGALTISLVAEINGKVVGHIAFSPVTISDGTPNWYALGPVSVLPDFQGQKIGTTLINQGLDFLQSIRAKGCALAGVPVYFKRFGFARHPQLILEQMPEAMFAAKSFVGKLPKGTIEFHEAFKQLSLIEKDALGDVIIEYDFGGAELDLSNPAIESLIKKEILVETQDGKVMMRPSALKGYDSYFARLSQFRATEVNRVHKNPIMRAINYGS